MCNHNLHTSNLTNCFQEIDQWINTTTEYLIVNDLPGLRHIAAMEFNLESLNKVLIGTGDPEDTAPEITINGFINTIDDFKRLANEIEKVNKLSLRDPAKRDKRQTWLNYHTRLKKISDSAQDLISGKPDYLYHRNDQLLKAV